MTKELVMEIMKKIEEHKEHEEHEDNESPRVEAWIKGHEDIVKWMTEPTKFPPRSDCG